MDYFIVVENNKDQYDPKVLKYEGVKDGIKAIESLKFLTKTFAKEIEARTVKVYMVVENAVS